MRYKIEVPANRIDAVMQAKKERMSRSNCFIIWLNLQPQIKYLLYNIMENLENYARYLRTTPINQEIIQLVRDIANQFEIREQILHYGIRRHFNNKMRVDIIDRKPKELVFLRVSRGAWMVKQNPLLKNLFDDNMKVIGKIALYDKSVIERKSFKTLFQLISDAPYWVWAIHHP